MSDNNEYITEYLPVLPLRGLVAFPETLIHFDVGRLVSMKALEASMKESQKVFLTAQKDVTTDIPGAEDLYNVGTICSIKQILRLPGDSIRVLVQGSCRAYATQFHEQDENCVFADVTKIDTIPGRISEKRKQALVRTLQERFEEYSQLSSHISRDIVLTVVDNDDPGYVADYAAQHIPISYQAKQELLEELHDIKRLERLTKIISEEIEILKIEGDLQNKLKAAVDKNQREYFLREQLKVIQEELGDGDEEHEADEYRHKIIELGLAPENEQKLLKEVDKMEKMQPFSAESTVIRNYLDTVLELPWNINTVEKYNLAAARKILDRDHYGLEKVKDRIMEFLAVKAMAPELKGQVLCLAGPPGVGKTSIARSVAEAMGRNYVRLSLGGVRDEADIRGHRKTYIGAMPGRIMNALSQAGSSNCLMLLDEIDKMGADGRGDPSSAMLEVLDTAQNNAFRDHFIELPFDLSDVLFITTANDIGAIPRPLLDRMEIIELGSYTEEEKTQIALRHLLPKQIKAHGLKKSNLSIKHDIMTYIINAYTREAGVRQLERLLAKICRKTAHKIAVEQQENPDKVIRRKITITRANIEDYLGNPKFKKDNVSTKDEIGVVNGLAWTSVGGEMLQVEAAVVSGSGKLEITGNLGDVMQESAHAAMTYVRSIADSIGINGRFYKENDIHIHFPEAAIPKDGPSAGVTIATALVSALTGIPVRHDVAMTGEVSIRGRVLPIGGLREKTMAAYRSGMKTVIVPEENQPDLSEIEPVVRDNVEFVIADTMQTVLDTALCRRPEKTKIDTLPAISMTGTAVSTESTLKQ